MESIKEQMVQAVEQMKANAFTQGVFQWKDASFSLQGKDAILALRAKDAIHALQLQLLQLRWGEDTIPAFQGKGEIPWYLQLLTTGFDVFVEWWWRLSADEGYHMTDEFSEDEWKRIVVERGPALRIVQGRQMYEQAWGEYGHHYYDSAFVKMLESVSTWEEMMMLLDMFADDCVEDFARVIVNGNLYAINPNLTPKAFEAFVDLRPDLFYEAIKSGKLLSEIFWDWKSEEVLEFVERALAYDRNYFRDYRDSLGNNCLHYFLMRFEISDCAERKMWSNNRCNYSVQSRIKTLLLENGVDADARNAAGYSYNDLAEYIEPYMYLATLYRDAGHRRPQDDDDDEYDESYSCVSYPTKIKRISNKRMQGKKRGRRVRKAARAA